MSEPRRPLTVYSHGRQRRLALTIVAMASTGWLAGCAPMSLLVTPVSADQTLRESVVLRESFWAIDKVALVDVDGMIMNGRPRSLTGFLGENPTSLFKEKLDRAAADPAVKAVVLRLNTPGGTVTASEIMYDELLRFKRRTGKPVVVCMMDVCASGGYYLSCAADHVVAHPTTITGSIGVVMMTPDFAGTMAKIGLQMNIIKSGAMKDAGSPFRHMENADRVLFQGLVNDMYAKFVDVVERGRPDLGRERILELADGRVYLGDEAKRLGLVDDVGTLHTALTSAKRLSDREQSKVVVVEYARPLAHRPNIYAGADVSPATALSELLPPWLEHSTPAALYLWSPGW